ncbi:Centrosomal protein poc5 [Chytridiales sp. JEL 0842]|nr:Centrosomal protein poc5 [Chytridiales sp. JEL 0842]
MTTSLSELNLPSLFPSIPSLHPPPRSKESTESSLSLPAQEDTSIRIHPVLNGYEEGSAPVSAAVSATSAASLVTDSTRDEVDGGECIPVDDVNKGAPSAAETSKPAPTADHIQQVPETPPRSSNLIQLTSTHPSPSSSKSNQPDPVLQRQDSLLDTSSTLPPSTSILQPINSAKDQEVPTPKDFESLAPVPTLESLLEPVRPSGDSASKQNPLTSADVLGLNLSMALNMLAQPTPTPLEQEGKVKNDLRAVSGAEEGDSDVYRFASSLEKWSGLMRRAILADFVDAKKDLVVRHEKSLEATGRKYVDSLSSLTTQLRDAQDLLSLYARRMEARNALVEKVGICFLKKTQTTTLSLLFSKWRTKLEHARKCAYANRLAIYKHQSTTLRKSLLGWQKVVGATWRRTMEKKVRAEAERALKELGDEYERRLGDAKELLKVAEGKLMVAEAEKARAHEEMKKALMRGVCALNMEAMSVFGQGGGGGVQGVGNLAGLASDLPLSAVASDPLRGAMFPDYLTSARNWSDTAVETEPVNNALSNAEKLLESQKVRYQALLACGGSSSHHAQTVSASVTQWESQPTSTTATSLQQSRPTSTTFGLPVSARPYESTVVGSAAFQKSSAPSAPSTAPLLPSSSMPHPPPSSASSKSVKPTMANAKSAPTRTTSTVGSSFGVSTTSVQPRHVTSNPALVTRHQRGGTGTSLVSVDAKTVASHDINRPRGLGDVGYGGVKRAGHISGMVIEDAGRELRKVM